MRGRRAWFVGGESRRVVVERFAHGAASNRIASSQRGDAPRFRVFSDVAPNFSLEDHIVLFREFLRDAAARIRPRYSVIAGFSSGGDFALRFAAAADAESRLRIDGCLSLGANLSIETCFLTRPHREKLTSPRSTRSSQPTVRIVTWPHAG